MVDTDRKWAGDLDRQQQIVQWFIANTAGDEPVDIVGACETILSNLVKVNAPDCAAAERQIDSIAQDMKQTVRECFAPADAEEMRQ